MFDIAHCAEQGSLNPGPCIRYWTPFALTGRATCVHAQHKPQGAPLQAGNRGAAPLGPAFRPVFAGRMDCFGPQPEYTPCPCRSAAVRLLPALG